MQNQQLAEAGLTAPHIAATVMNTLDIKQKMPAVLSDITKY